MSLEVGQGLEGSVSRASTSSLGHISVVNLNRLLDQVDDFHPKYPLFLMKLHGNVQGNSATLLLPFSDD